MSSLRLSARIASNIRNISSNTLRTVNQNEISSVAAAATTTTFPFGASNNLYSIVINRSPALSMNMYPSSIGSVRYFSQDSSSSSSGNGTTNGTENSSSSSSSSSTNAQNNNTNTGDQDPKDKRITDLTNEIEGLKKKLTQAEKDRLYQAAEMENVRRIAKNDVAKIKEYAAQPLAKSLLLAVDNLNSALNSIPSKATEGNKPFADLVEGLQATQKIFMKVLGEHGVTIFGTIGDKFDFNKYEAVTSVPLTEGKEPNTVASVFQQGYTFKDRILRPAQVAVYSK